MLKCIDAKRHTMQILTKRQFIQFKHLTWMKKKRCKLKGHFVKLNKKLSSSGKYNSSPFVSPNYIASFIYSKNDLR